jgi:TolA-binding protein
MTHKVNCAEINRHFQDFFFNLILINTLVKLHPVFITIKIKSMKKYCIITFFLLFAASTFSFAQVDSSDLMSSIGQVNKQQKKMEKQQKKVQRANRKLEKQQKRLNRQNRKLNKENKRTNKEMREMEREQKKLQEAKPDSTSGASLNNFGKLNFPNRFNEKSVFTTFYTKQNALIKLNRKSAIGNRKSNQVNIKIHQLYKFC